MRKKQMGSNEFGNSNMRVNDRNKMFMELWKMLIQYASLLHEVLIEKRCLCYDRAFDEWLVPRDSDISSISSISLMVTFCSPATCELALTVLHKAVRVTTVPDRYAWNSSSRTTCCHLNSTLDQCAASSSSSWSSVFSP